MMVIAVGQFLLALVVCSTHVAICSMHGNVTDRLSLLEFKDAISLDPQKALMSWNDSTHFCDWEGVSCSPRNQHRVTSLDLSGRGLQGRISISLGNLTFLKSLSLPNNMFTGQIPSSLGHLQQLQNLSLSNNTLQGEIPDLANCSSLHMLWLDGNHLVGQIPTHANLPLHIHTLQISYNNLTGKIPISLFNVTTLTRIGIAYNQISGEIPSEIGNMPMLEFFFAGENRLSGGFQPAILNLSSLVILSLPSNYLNGQLPSNLGSALPNLQKFGLFNNLFDGHIPNSLVNASKLSLVDMSSNNFTGVVPSSIGKLKNLSWLNLEYNQLQARDRQDWEFMNSLGNCTELRLLSLHGNRLEGRLSDSFTNLSAKLELFLIGRNRLSGGFPAGIANLHRLNFLALEENQFTGVIPEWLGTLKDLRLIELTKNAFTGYIPPSLSNLSLLGQLVLDSNQLHGHIPPSLGNLSALEALKLSNNFLDGSIPMEIYSIPSIREIVLSSNSLGGPLPTEVGRAKQLQYLYLSSNNLSSAIPDTLGNCESMEYIELDHNFLSGSIPASLGSIRNLQVLNVSHNSLSGSIPKSIGSLMYLEKLDLSFNNLEGEVPETTGIFKNVTALRIDGNKGLCGGAEKLHLPACLVIPSNSAKHVTSTVLKVVIPLVSMVSLAMVIFVLLFWRRKRKKSNMSISSFGRNFPRVSYHDLDRATNGFSTSNLIGRGGYSSVYKGRLLQDETLVAVKVFTLETRGAQKSFIAECNALRNVRHRNLVPILTACSSIDSKGDDFKALVYEFMPKGDLHALLYSASGNENTSNSERITLAQRLSILVDVADALEYLHHDNQGTIVHCDLKPSNILLDDNMIAHAGDFGLARFKTGLTPSHLGDSISTSSTIIKGTIGYVAPECANGGEVSVAGDVYSYGIILFETLLRKRPTDNMFKDGLSIANFVEMNFPTRISQIVDSELLQDQPEIPRDFVEMNFPTGISPIVDSGLLQDQHEIPRETPVATKEKDLDCLLSVLNVGLCCTKLSPSERPNMHEVAVSLHGVKKAYLGGR